MIYVASDSAASKVVQDQQVLEGSRVLAKEAECEVLAINATRLQPDRGGFVICLHAGYGQADET